ncbi:MAG: HU family DNA-binding protein [Mollicutes bacterium PWAP]|nr:HU family DNA-binding protein [Mollicutes bacterium PWAP]
MSNEIRYTKNEIFESLAKKLDVSIDKVEFMYEELIYQLETRLSKNEKISISNLGTIHALSKKNSNGEVLYYPKLKIQKNLKEELK